MLARQISNILRLFISNDLIYKYSLALEVISINISLFIYYFTSKSLNFDSNILSQTSHSSYFNYIVLGELFISIPIFFFDGTFRRVKEALVQGVWMTYALMPIPKLKAIFSLMLSSAPKETLRLITTFGCAKIFFDLEISLSSALGAFGLIVITAPIFIAIGLILSVFLIRTGRGQSALSYTNTALTIGAGAYFPLSVLPKSVAEILKASPLTYTLEGMRYYINTNTFEYAWENFIYLAPWYVLVPLSIIVVKYYLEGYENIKDIVIRI